MLRHANSVSPAELAAIMGAAPRRPRLTWLIAGSIVATYIVQLAGLRAHVDVVGNALAIGPAAIAQHRYWTFLTYAWAHALPVPSVPAWAQFHLAMNVVPLVCIAPALERRGGPWWLLALYGGGAIASACAWLASHPPAGEEMIGASGALFALIGAGGIRGVQIWRADFVFFQFPLRLDLRLVAPLLCGLELVQLHGWGLTDVAHASHLGGALFGAIFALVVPPRSAR